MPDPTPYPAGLPPGAAMRMSAMGGILAAAGAVCFLWDGLPAKRVEWGVICSVLGAGFFSLGLHLKGLVNAWRLEGFHLVTGDRRDALSVAGTDAAPAVARGENFAIELGLVSRNVPSVESATCRIRLSERSEKRHGDSFLYKTLFETVVDSPIADPAPGRNARVRFAFLLKTPADRPPSGERHRWEVTVIVKVRGAPDFSATAPIRVV